MASVSLFPDMPSLLNRENGVIAISQKQCKLRELTLLGYQKGIRMTAAEPANREFVLSTVTKGQLQVSVSPSVAAKV